MRSFVALIFGFILTFLVGMDESAASVGENYRSPSRDSVREMTKELRKIRKREEYELKEEMRKLSEKIKKETEDMKREMKRVIEENERKRSEE